jgi:hypothetical protein
MYVVYTHTHTCSHERLSYYSRAIYRPSFLGVFAKLRKATINMYKYIQRDATVSWLLFQELYQELYMFRAFTMPIIRSNITAILLFLFLLLL